MRGNKLRRQLTPKVSEHLTMPRGARPVYGERAYTLMKEVKLSE
jgi:hypothetical protein